MLVNMKEILERASRENYAVGAPNVSSELDARAFIETAEEMSSPLILDVDYTANPDIILFGKILCALAEQSSVPIAVNLDHGADFHEVYRALQAGFTSVMIDRSSCPDEVNIRDVKHVVDICHACGVSVEAELGHVGQAVNYEEDRQYLTDPKTALLFVEKTGVDALAIAIGTAHGAYAKGVKPYIDFERLELIKRLLGRDFPLVLHGSSGTEEEDIREACRRGINKVNIANDLCRAVADAVQKADLSGNRVYDIYEIIRSANREKMKHMIEVYGSAGKAWKKETEGLPKNTTTLNEG